jgi:hypothetical protein
MESSPPVVQDGDLLAVRGKSQPRDVDARLGAFQVGQYRSIPHIYIEQQRTSSFPEAQTLGKTLHDWQEEIVRMWRFSKNNGITEGFHRKMKLIQRRAYGIKSFDNYRLRVIAQCG